MKPNLELYIPDIPSLCAMKIEDITCYPENWVVECKELWITPPGFKYATKIDLTQENINWTKILTACDIGLQTTNCEEVRAELPDGVYTIKYAINPVDKLYVEYNIFRTAQLRKQFNDLLCCISNMKLLDADIRLLEDTINKIVFNLEAIKAFCNYENRIDEAMRQYKETQKLIDSAKCRYCGC